MSAEGESQPPLNIAGTAKSFAAQSTLVPSDQTRLQDPLQAVVPPPVVGDEARLGTYRGQIWDDFELGELIGYGGMGAVYRGRQITLDRPVAIKVLGRHLSEDDSFRQRFLREARAVAQINSPNVVQIYSAGTHSGHHFFVMELIDGVDLARMLREGFRPSNAQAFDLVLQAARGLVAAGRLGIVHRDIKPANMLLTRDRVLKITDFGLVKTLSEDAPHQPPDGLTATGIIIGTAGYFSPEQGLGERCDQRTDLYALGVVAFQLLTGRLPFIAEDTTSVIYQHVHEPVPRLRSFNPSVHPELERVILNCLQKKPIARPQSAEELVHELEQVAISGHISATDQASGARHWGLAAMAMLLVVALLTAGALMVTHARLHGPGVAPDLTAGAADANVPLDGEQRHQALSDVANDSDGHTSDASVAGHEPTVGSLESANEAAIQRGNVALAPLAATPTAGATVTPPGGPAPVLAPIAMPAAPGVVPAPRSAGGIRSERPVHPDHDPLASGPVLAASHPRTYAPLPAHLIEPEEPRPTRPAHQTPVVVPVVSSVDGALLTTASTPATTPGRAAPAPTSDGPSERGAPVPETPETPDAVPAASTAAAPVPPAAPAIAALAATGANDTSDRFGRYRDVHILTQSARFRWCPPTRFLMGSPPDEAHRNDDEQLHIVDLSHGFWIMDRECSQALWDAVMGYDPASNQDLGCPVENVSCNDVQGFIATLNHLTTGLTARLPSEAEWECAARAGDAPTVRPRLDAAAWYAGNSRGVSQHCASLQPNAWGVFDCLGNVAEWCGDSYGPYQGPLSIDPHPHGTGAPVVRGGSFRDGVGVCRLAQREHARAAYRSPWLGFRLAASAVPEPAMDATAPQR